jgi:hypothetical protein
VTSPKNPQQLAHAIEALVASYVDEMRRVAHGALDQAFAGRSASTRRAPRSRAGDQPEEADGAKRRSSAELAEVRELLYELVCARPGEAMPVFAEEIGLPLRALQRPMSKLKAEGRVRCVGERNLARYFPGLERRPRNAGA